MPWLKPDFVDTREGASMITQEETNDHNSQVKEYNNNKKSCIFSLSLSLLSGNQIQFFCFLVSGTAEDDENGEQRRGKKEED